MSEPQGKTDNTKHTLHIKEDRYGDENVKKKS